MRTNIERPHTLRVEKPWGGFAQYVLNTACTVKVLTCLPGERLSLQRHEHRSELWIILDDGAVVDLDGTALYPQKGDELWLPSGSAHRLGCSASAYGPVRVLEISLGNFDEKDIERIEDSYGRI